VINKSNNDLKDVHFELVGVKGTLKLVGSKFHGSKQGMISGTLFIEINQYLLSDKRS
jgi:hypothetical protein